MKKSISETVREIITPTVEELGYRIWDITFGKIGADYHLEITIDSDSGIGIEDCEKVHRAIDPLLDEKDPIEGFYYLEVSSPGLERELRTKEHIRLSIGQPVEAKLYTAKDGKKSFSGRLADYDGERLTIEEGGVLTVLSAEEISKIHTLYDDAAEAADIREDERKTQAENAGDETEKQ